MDGRSSAVRQAGLVRIGVHGDGGDVRNGSEGRIGVFVGMAGHRWNMVVGSAAFVVAEEEDGVFPLGTGHEAVHYLRHLRLPLKNRLARSGMLIVVAVTGLNECKAGKRVV